MEKNNRILIVDDQKDLCEQLAKLLMQTGRANETLSLVQQMRAKLIGIREEITGNKESEDDTPKYEIEYVHQGQDAVEKVSAALKSSSPYALIFLDMRMPPGWDGLETAKRIRELDKDVEIVIMTAYADHDQKQICEQVGHPEKLLYIKKPFQAEEIFQLALSLTTKWNLEWTERRRKKWLESIIKGLCKLKTPSSAKSYVSAFISALKAFLDMMESEKGMAISLENDKWQLQCYNGIDEDFALKFINEHSDFLKECRTTKHKDDKYFLPIKKDNFNAMIVVFDVKTKNDPEWYKLLSILSMTVSDILSDAYSKIPDTNSKNELVLAQGLLKKFSTISDERIGSIISNFELIKEQEPEQLVLDVLRNSTYKLEEIGLDIRNAVILSGEFEFKIRKDKILDTIKEGLLLGSHGRAAIKVEGDQSLELNTAIDTIRDIFANLARVSSKIGREGDLWIEVKVSHEKGILRFSYSDNSSGIPAEKQDKIFCPFSQTNIEDMCLPAVAAALKKMAGSIKLAQESPEQDGMKVLIELPIPSA